MSWTYNTLKIVMRNADAAKDAANVIKAFVKDNTAAYPCMNADRFVEDLKVVNNAVVVDESFSVDCDEYFALVPIMCKALAEVDAAATFAGYANAHGEYEDTYHTITFFDNTLIVTSKYFPEGDGYYCPNEDCGEFVGHYEDFDENGTFVCQDCGTEYTMEQLKGVLPTVTKNTWTIL